MEPRSEQPHFRIPKAAELVADHLRGRIVRGDLRRDDVLPSETSLSEQFKVSRPTLREALRILESEGLVVVRRGVRGGARVQVPSTEVATHYAGLVLQHRGATLADVLDARLIVEVPVAGLVAARPDHVGSADLLREHVRRYNPKVTDPDSARVFHDFNRTLASRSGNETLILVVTMLEDISEAASRGLNSELPVQHIERLMSRAARTRLRLADLIEAGDRLGAEALWRAYLEEAGTVMAGNRAGRVVDLLS